MRDHYSRDHNEPQEPVIAPSACPACRGSDIKTTSKVVTAETYWRCVACGEVWNVRRRQASRNSRFGSFRS
jgi:hypothetical protein